MPRSRTLEEWKRRRDQRTMRKWQKRRDAITERVKRLSAPVADEDAVLADLFRQAQEGRR